MKTTKQPAFELGSQFNKFQLQASDFKPEQIGKFNAIKLGYNDHGYNEFIALKINLLKMYFRL